MYLIIIIIIIIRSDLVSVLKIFSGKTNVCKQNKCICFGYYAYFDM